MDKETGSVKFNCTWIKDQPLDFELIKELNKWRDKLYESGLIGVNEEGIGYGNISIRFDADTFIITGSSTGKLKNLTREHYTRVTDYNIDKNTLTTVGPIIASSESLTHAAIYKHQRDINAVIHVHHSTLWEHLLQNLPATDKNIEYGTPAMAIEISRLFKERGLAEQKIFAMAGHKDGVVSFGKDLSEAGQIIFDQLVFPGSQKFDSY